MADLAHLLGTLLAHMALLTTDIALGWDGALLEHMCLAAARTDQGLGTLRDEMALLLAVAAALRTSIGAVLAHVTLLVADTTLASKGARVRTVGLVVA